MSKDIIIFDPHTLDKLGFIKNHSSIVFKRESKAEGSFELWCSINDNNKELIKDGNIIYLSKDKAGIIQYIEQKIDDKGIKSFDVKGKLIKYYASYRILMKTYNVYKKYTTDVMNTLMMDNFINPSDVKRKFANMRLSPNTQSGKGEVITFQKTGGEVSESLSNIASAYSCVYDIELDAKNKLFEFKAYAGVDRTIDQLIVEPVILSSALNDITDSKYVKNTLDEKNVVLVTGQGEGEDRKKVLMGETTKVGVDRKEMYVDARDISTTVSDDEGTETELTEEEYNALLKDRGNEKKADAIVFESFDAVINPNGNNAKFGVDYFLGDYVTIEDVELGVRVNAEISAVEESYSGSDGYVLKLTFGYMTPSIMKKMNNVRIDANTPVSNSELNKKVDDVKVTTETTNQTLRTVQSDLNGTKETLSSVQGNVVTVTGTVSTLSGQVATVQSQISDTAQRVNTMETTVNGFSSTISSLDSRVSTVTSTVDGLVSEQSTLTSKINTMQSTVDGTSQTVSSLQQNITNNYSTTTQMQTAISTSVNGFKSEVSSTYTTKSEFNSLQIGGRNLALDSSKGWNTTAFNVIQGTLSENWTVGETYTVSLKGSTTDGYFRLYRDSGQKKCGDVKSIGNGIFRLTFICMEETDTSQALNTFSIYHIGNDGATSIIDWIKIEKGSKNTDYSPAPEDVAYTKSIISAINQTAETVKISASKLELTGAVTFSTFDSATQSKINAASSDASTAKTNAASAISTANSASSNANSAVTTANSALSTANTAKLLTEVETISSNMKKFKNVCGYTYDPGNITGMLLIITPITPSRMVQLHIKGYNFANTKETIDLEIGFYNYVGGFGSTGFINKGSFPITSVSVAKVSTSDTRAVIYIGAESTVWTHPKIIVDEVITGYSTSPDSYKDGFSAKITTAKSYTTHALTISGKDTFALSVGADAAIAEWCYANNRTYINGSKIYAGTVTANQISANAVTADKIAANAITADKISTNALKSRNYVANSTGSFLNLADGSFSSKNLSWDSIGNVSISGDITASKGKIKMMYPVEKTIVDVLELDDTGTRPYLSINFSDTIYINMETRMQLVSKNIDFYSESITMKGIPIVDNGNIYSKGSIYTDLGTCVVSPNADIVRLISANGYMEVMLGTGAKYGITWWASDSKLKKDITNTNVSGIDFIKKLSHYQYNWKDVNNNEHVNVGYLANDLKVLDSNLAFEVKQGDKSEYDSILQIDSTKLIPYISKALQEVITYDDQRDRKINLLQQQVYALQFEVQQLKGGNVVC